MPMEQIEYTIRADGSVEERVVGLAGSDCEALTRDIDEKLGVVERRERTPEYYRQAAGQAQTQRTGR